VGRSAGSGAKSEAPVDSSEPGHWHLLQDSAQVPPALVQSSGEQYSVVQVHSVGALGKS
jgi:hypothetical protein